MSTLQHFHLVGGLLLILKEEVFYHLSYLSISTLIHLCDFNLIEIAIKSHYASLELGQHAHFFL
jgi:hypothetical protein